MPRRVILTDDVSKLTHLEMADANLVGERHGNKVRVIKNRHGDNRDVTKEEWERLAYENSPTIIIEMSSGRVLRTRDCTIEEIRYAVSNPTHGALFKPWLTSRQEIVVSHIVSIEERL